MNSETTPHTAAPRETGARRVATTGDIGHRSRVFGKGNAALLAQGEPMLWLMGGALTICLVMIVGLLALVLANGVSTFWPASVTQVALHNGAVHLGEITRENNYTPSPQAIERLPEAARKKAAGALAAQGGESRRRLFRTGNFELTREHFNWISDYQVAEESRPPWVTTVERLSWGRFYGEPVSFQVWHATDDVTQIPVAERNRVRTEAARRIAAELGDKKGRTLHFAVGANLLDPAEVVEPVAVTAVVEVWSGPEPTWAAFQRFHGDIRERGRQRRDIEKIDIGHVNHRIERARLALRTAELRLEAATVAGKPDLIDRATATVEAQRIETERINHEAQDDFERLRKAIAELNRENDRYRMVMRVADGRETTLKLADIVRAYPANRIGFWARLSIYLSRWREFLLDDPREANMEGGVFPAIFGTVIMTLAMSLAVLPFGVLAALYLREYAKGGPLISTVRIAVNNLAGVPSIVFGVFGLGFFCYFVGAEIDQIFFEAKLPSPTYGTGGILWASLTLALLTLPVVIVATEEALSAVPSSMREGSYACGASKWQTIRRIVLPRAMPGIMTGMILAMARGAGEVAPIMLVGAVKLAPELPIDGMAPFIHLERSFMHLGFHIFDLGFQSQNSEAAEPMVYTTTLLLVAIVAALNLAAVIARNKLRRRFVTGAF